ncbi:MAG: phosphoribosylanthranilate isomerase [Paracoccaceae bacterium]|nr:phosphoribosylanthranilate isomerase [Paracoccaceae bacterium]MDE2915160.1 phosphoribosylanthranilate isomerase [Paracoccaceae bacterium]
MKVKICGLSDAASLEASVSGGADYVGFVFFARSPRNVPVDRARALSARVPEGVCRTALFVDPDDAYLAHVLDRVRVDMIQLHGDETPDRVTEVRNRFGLPVMKAVGIAEPGDIARLDLWPGVADQLLCDARPAPGSSRPGGGGIPFDWSVLAACRWRMPWMLAGGLTPENLEEAARQSRARQFDVSTGVESAPGVKDGRKIAAFLRVAGRLAQVSGDDGDAGETAAVRH